MESPSRTTTECLHPKVERALYATGALASTFYRAITTIRQVKSVASYAPDAIRSFYRQQRIARTYYNELLTTSYPLPLDKPLKEETGQDTPTEQQQYNMGMSDLWIEVQQMRGLGFTTKEAVSLIENKKRTPYECTQDPCLHCGRGH